MGPIEEIPIASDDDDREQTTAQLEAPLLEHDEAPTNEAPEQIAEEAPEQTPEEPDEGRSTILGVGINLANAIVGSGIVGLPAALKDAGLGLGCLLLVGMALTVHVVVVALVRDAEVLKATCYGGLAKKALGSLGEVLVCGGQFVFDVGAALTYLIIFGDTAVSSVEFFVAKPCQHLRLICVAGAGLAALPPCLLRDVSGLEGISLLSVAAVFAATGVVISELCTRGQKGTLAITAPENEGRGVVAALGLFAFAFVCQDSCFLYYRSLKQRTPSRFSKSTGLALGSSALLCVLFSAAGYLTYGAQTSSNILNDYPIKDVRALIARLLYAVTMVFGIPSSVFVCRQPGHALHRAASTKYRDASVEDVRLVSSRTHGMWSLGLWASLVGVALSTDSLGAVMALTGAVAGSLIGFILPGLIFSSPVVLAAREKPRVVWRRVVSFVLVSFGLALVGLSFAAVS